jgi:hypothetical protein
LKLNEILLEKKLRVLDFDDTLITSKSRILLKNAGKTTYLTPAEYAKYVPKKGDEFDYSEFSKLISPTNIKNIVKQFQLMIAKASTGGSRVEILTARNTPKPVDQWLDSMGIKKIPVKALGNADPQAKARYIEGRIKDGFDDIVFFDDSIKNIQAVQSLSKKYPKIKIQTRHVRL